MLPKSPPPLASEEIRARRLTGHLTDSQWDEVLWLYEERWYHDWPFEGRALGPKDPRLCVLQGTVAEVAWRDRVGGRLAVLVGFDGGIVHAQL